MGLCLCCFDKGERVDLVMTRFKPVATYNSINVSLGPTSPATFIDGARLSARGTVRPVPLDVDAQVQVRRASLAYVDPYVESYLNLTIARGQVWSTGRLQLSSTPGGELSRIGFNGEVSFNDFSALDKVSTGIE